ncbi:hypothetical protein BDV12DRAFT_7645 [Aspergillus spectabilis]
MSRRDRKNEAGWRFTIEPEVLYRFSVEVTCPRCRSRLWQSEIEAAVQSSHPFAESLKARRQKRLPCQCLDQWGYSSAYEYGVNMLFSDRAQAAIKYREPIPIKAKRKNDQRSEEPDRVYGLRETESFQKVLDSTDRRTSNDARPRKLRESVEMCPFNDEGDQLLFPFLILEAKSGKLGDMAAVEMQTCFSIQRLLKLQYDLQRAGNNNPGKLDPLVWFLVCMGERWSVSGCFVNDTGGPVEWVIVNLWSGDIQSEDGSLQLLLIIDYIFDWARDVYRESLLTELRSLAVNELMGTDPDIFSTIERESTVWSMPPTSVDNIPNPVISNEEFLHLVHPQGVVRDAAVIESRFLGLCITENDTEQFILSFNSHEVAREMILSMVKILEDPWYLSADTLAGVEELWTGKSRGIPNDVPPDSIFFVKANLIMYISSDWQPVRQLSCLAVTEAAMRKLLQDPSTNCYRTPVTATVTLAAIQKLVNQLQSQSTIDSLTAATSIQCLSSTISRHAATIESQFRVKNSRPFAGFKPDSSPYILEFVLSVFESHKVGRRFSPDNYLRSSSRRSEQNRHTRGPKMWPNLQQLALHRNGCVLIDGMQHVTDSSPCCLYTVDGTFQPDEAASLVDQVSNDGCYYSTFLLGPGNDIGPCFSYLNSPTDDNRYWKDEKNHDRFETWGRDLRNSYAKNMPVHGSSTRPISISSSDGLWDEGSQLQEREMTVAWKAEE